MREALAKLVGEDLLKPATIAACAVPMPSITDVEDVYRIRIALEREALTLAMQHGDDAWEGSILAAAHRLEKAPLPDAVQDKAMAVEGWEARHRAFHTSLISAAPAPRLLRLIDQMVDHTERYRALRLAHVDRVKLRGDMVSRASPADGSGDRPRAGGTAIAAPSISSATCRVVVGILQQNTPKRTKAAG